MFPIHWFSQIRTVGFLDRIKEWYIGNYRMIYQTLQNSNNLCRIMGYWSRPVKRRTSRCLWCILSIVFVNFSWWFTNEGASYTMWLIIFSFGWYQNNRQVLIKSERRLKKKFPQNKLALANFSLKTVLVEFMVPLTFFTWASNFNST